MTPSPPTAKAELDLLIAVDTSIVHLAGALNRPAWLLPRASEWRWLAEREDSPWYPTLRLFWQRRYRNWAKLN
jgi:ADP-heptose:LPS heptosyltransferase